MKRNGQDVGKSGATRRLKREGMTPLRKRRTDLNLSQVDVAERAKIPQESYSRYERGIYFPRVDEALRLAQILHIETGELRQYFKEPKRAKAEARP